MKGVLRTLLPCMVVLRTPDSRRNKIASVDRFALASLVDWDWRPMLRGVTARALIVRGTEDVLSNEKDWVSSLPNARLFVLHMSVTFPTSKHPSVSFLPWTQSWQDADLTDPS